MNAQDKRHGHAAEEKTTQRDGLVLLAEDDAINRKVIAHQLGTLGLSVDMASDGLEALALWRAGRATRRHDLLLTDLRMPSVDGCTLASTIRREESADARIPIVALSGNALSGQFERCRSAGMDDFLTKPVRIEQLGDMVERWLPSHGTPATKGGAVAQAGPGGPEVEPAYVYDDLALAQWIGDDAALQADFRGMFVVSARRTLDDLRRAAECGDSAALADQARRLRSSAQAVGAVSLAACCDPLSGRDPTGSSTGMHRQLAQLQAALAHATARMTDHAG